MVDHAVNESTLDADDQNDNRATDKSMIDVQNVTVTYGNVTALADIDFHVNSGEFVTLIGPSGCGKTTLLRTIGGVQQPTDGTVKIEGNPPSTAQSNGEVGFVFQRHTLLPWKTALDNVVFLRRLAGKPPARERARARLRAMGLAEFSDSYPSELSGGMKQRVAIARAIHLGATVLLMDEPLGELDEITREKMSVEVRRLWQQQRKTVIFVTHSVPEAIFLADRCVVMADEPGRIVQTFDVDLPRPRNEEVYGSQAFQDHVATVREILYKDDDEHH